ncbi:hypothetical protein B0F90DRAFT_1815685 [Multifurca ochricompacta]|uniref:Uncharacterized protein n=1 Tax=Multifurca ochricompacta TaxID=376703 RepID=A0AAD4M6T8_9AGAM|nr:hypothetical protein B0F90DRAFT_1815685 [Multifurca ochricompacta]
MTTIPSREYTILLSHLHKPSSSLPLTTHQSLISHFLAQTPTPTQLTATVISSPLFRPFAHAKLAALLTAFRHAVHLRLKALEDEDKSLFSRGIRFRMAEWVRSLVKGFKGGQAVIRFVCAGGTLLGLEDLKEKLGTDPGGGTVRAKIEDELIIALTEIMELYGAPKDNAWEKEFQPETERGELDVLSLTLLFTAQLLPHVFSERVKVLPLSTLSSHLMTVIENTFASGSFLASLPSSCSPTPSGQLSLTTPVGPKRPSFPYDGPGPWTQAALLPVALKNVVGSPLFSAVPSLASITARILPLLTESSPLEGLNTLEAVITRLEKVASNVENDWARSALAGIEDENDIGARLVQFRAVACSSSPNIAAPESRELAENIWTVLKTLLFTTIMLLQSILSTIVYSSPVACTIVSLQPKPSSAHLPTHSSLALLTLRTLSQLSFVISKFGGVTSTSGAGFAELKRVFYSALDVLSVDAEASEKFVKALSTHAPASSSLKPQLAEPLTRARQAFNLACVEQLVPLLSLDTIEYFAFPLCLPHLDDASHRETYESAHSVILAVFAAHALERPDSTILAEVQGTDVSRHAFVEKIVPFYVQCLLENSTDGKLTTPQLRLAFGALTSSASASTPAMGLFCLSSLLSMLSALSTPDSAQQRHRLCIVLVSTLSALPLVILPHALTAVASAIRNSQGEERRELTGEVFKEIMENVGDREKEYCLRWWEEQSEALEGNKEMKSGDSLGKGKGKGKSNAARL